MPGRYATGFIHVAAVPGVQYRFFGKSRIARKPVKWGLLGLSALEIIIKTALSQVEVFYENAEMECSFTPGVKSRTHAHRGRERGKRVG